MADRDSCGDRNDRSSERRARAGRPPTEPQDYLETAFQESPAATAVVRAEDGLFLEANRGFERLFGYDRGELVGRSFLGTVLCDRAEGERLVHRVRERGEARDEELRLRRRDGRVLETRASAVPLRFEGQDCLLVMMVDVTERKAAERELREREERLRTVFETSQAGIILVDPEGRITFANRRMAAMFGCTLEELIGSTYPEHLHPEARRVGDERMRRLIAGEIDHVHVERRYLRRDGSDFWGYLSGRRHEDAAGNLVSLVGVIADITDRKKAEESIRDSEARYRTLIELAADTILLGDPEGNIINANLSAVALTGYPAEELVGTNIARLFQEGELRRSPLRYDLLKQGLAVRTERVLTRKDGSAVPIEMNTKQMPDGTYQTFIRDFSERKRTEAVLRASEEKFATAFHRAPLLMSLSAVEDGRFLDVNETLCRVSGYRREELLGRTSVEVGWVSAEDRDRLVGELERSGRIKDLELTLTARDGRRVPCLYSGESVTIEGTRRLLSIALDLTDKLRLEEELARAQKLESLGVLAGGIAHDFNNILTGVLGNLSVARALVGEGHRAAERLAECEKAAVRASELTRQLLTFARGGAPVKKGVETGRLVREAFSFALRGSNVKGVVEIGPDLWRLHADEGQINQVLNNLLINATQVMTAGGTVTARAVNVALDEPSLLPLPAGRYVRLDIEDTGPGIPREIVDRVFDPYFTTKVGGSGLGLSSVYSIVRRHGGCVQVASPPGRGAAFTIHLPAADTQTAETDRPAATARPSEGSGRVLVMDDEAMIRDLACAMLQTLGYEPVACPDGASAVDLYREALDTGKPFTAVILDLTVPGAMGGREAAERIRARDPGALLVVSSGYSNDPVVADCRAAGFSGAVVKPYSLQTLGRELARLLEGRGPIGR